MNDNSNDPPNPCDALRALDPIHRCADCDAALRVTSIEPTRGPAVARPVVRITRCDVCDDRERRRESA